MAFRFSTWLRETGRLYLRYMAVALASVPLAAGVAWSKHAGWNEHIVVSVSLTLGVITAFLILKVLGRWQVEPEVKVIPFDAKWADLLRARRESMVLFSITPADDFARAWQEVLSKPFGVEGPADAQMFQIVWSQHHQAALGWLRNLTTPEAEDALQQLMKGTIEPTRTKEPSRRRNRQFPSQVIPMQSLLAGSLG